MTGRTHAAIGIVSTIPFIPKSNPEMILLVPFVLLGALLPDIDAGHCLIKTKKYINLALFLGLVFLVTAKHNYQYIALFAIMPLAFIFERTEHRTATHSILGLLVFSVCVFFAAGGFALPFMLGYVTHLIADSITTSGIPLFYPKHKRIGLRLFDTGSVGEAIIKYGCFAVIGMKIISFFQ